jgi:hypothetical protein
MLLLRITLAAMADVWVDAKQVVLLAIRRPIVSTTDRSRETLMA